jgi:luciferase family oxidoreductase group 1
MLVILTDGVGLPAWLSGTRLHPGPNYCHPTNVSKTVQIPYSVLDLAAVKDGGTIAGSFAETLSLAQHAETWGYKRFWLAEHHNMIGIASAATSVLIGYVASGTSHIRVGSGGVMLPNHAPLVIAEQFGTLETLYPKRIDLGLGRAPGTDGPTFRALRRGPDSAEDFPEQVQELLSLLELARPGQIVRAVPGAGTRVPVWLLGSSTFSVQLAARMGLPFAFAAHFAPQQMRQALYLYRTGFRPSQWLDQPYAMACIPVVAAETDAEAAVLATSLQLRFLQMVRGVKDALLLPPVASMTGLWTDQERAHAQSMLSELMMGGPQSLEQQLTEFLKSTPVDELMISCNVYDAALRLRSYQIVSEAMSGFSRNAGLAAKPETAEAISRLS